MWVKCDWKTEWSGQGWRKVLQLHGSYAYAHRVLKICTVLCKCTVVIILSHNAYVTLDYYCFMVWSTIHKHVINLSAQPLSELSEINWEFEYVLFILDFQNFWSSDALQGISFCVNDIIYIRLCMYICIYVWYKTSEVRSWQSDLPLVQTLVAW